MKKTLSFIAITALLFACSKTDITPGEYSEAVAAEKAKGGNGGGNGGGGGGSSLVVTTDEASYILPFGATSGGSVSSSGGGNKVTERGVCFSTDPNPTIDDVTIASGSGSGTFSSILPGLADGTLYYARAYANKTKNGNISTTYGNEVSFTTPLAVYGSVTDIDGNTYTTIEIGTQVWMMENLKTTKYRNGDVIPNVTDDVSWAGQSSGAYCNFDNNVNNVADYGRLYNWYAVDDSRNIAPAGWHVPTTEEWRTLVNYVGGGTNYYAGGKLKEAGYAHWDPYTYTSGLEGNNSSGFTALGGGERTIYSTGTVVFRYWRHRGNLWTANSSGGDNADFIYLQYNSTGFWGSIGLGQGSDNHDKRCGYSVRLVKD